MSETKDYMQPRIIITNPWPWMNEDEYQVGKVYNVDKDHFKDWEIMYPANIKKISWWEHRDISDMPEYVLQKSTGNILAVFDWQEIVFWHCKSANSTHEVSELEPATLERYTSFINNKK